MQQVNKMKNFQYMITLNISKILVLNEKIKNSRSSLQLPCQKIKKS